VVLAFYNPKSVGQDWDRMNENNTFIKKCHINTSEQYTLRKNIVDRMKSINHQTRKYLSTAKERFSAKKINIRRLHNIQKQPCLCYHAPVLTFT